MYDLHGLAVRNEESVRERYADERASLPPAETELLERFRACVAARGRVVVNMKPAALAAVMDGQPYLNMHEVAHQKAVRSGRTEDESLRKLLGEWYERRMTFDGLFANGREFRYGALSIGGTGPTQFGYYSVVLHDIGGQTDSGEVYVRQDSLSDAYHPRPHVVDMDAFGADLATHSTRGDLAGAKLADRVPKAPESTWPSILCGGDLGRGYVEVIFRTDVTSDSFRVIRIPRGEYRRLRNMTYGTALRRRKLDRRARLEVRAFTAVATAQDKGSHEVERV